MSLKLKDIYLFQNLDEKLIFDIIDNSRNIKVNSGEEIIKQGDNSNGNAYIIKDGIASVEINSRRIKTLKQGNIFGEIALITNEPRTATITAITDLKLLKINKKLLFEIIKDFPNGKQIQETILKRITENTQNS